MPPRLLADRNDRWMADLALDRDSIEALLQGLCTTDELHLVALPYVLLDHAGYCEDAEPRLAKDLRQCRIIQLTDDLGPNVLGREPLLQQPTEHRVIARQEEGSIVERAGELPLARLGELRGGEESRTGLTEQMIERSDGSAGSRWCVRQ